MKEKQFALLLSQLWLMTFFLMDFQDLWRLAPLFAGISWLFVLLRMRE